MTVADEVAQDVENRSVAPADTGVIEEPDDEQHHDARRNKGGLDRSQKLGLLAVVALTLLGGLAIAIVVLVPSKNNNTTSSSSSSSDHQSERFLQNTFVPSSPPATTAAASFSPTASSLPSSSPTTSAAPSYAPTVSPAPSTLPSSSPTMAPTVPALGCRGDRFDNEGNMERNNRLFAGQYVCSDDDEQRYMFGVDPTTGNLILRDTLTNQLKTYYTNEYHLQQQQQQQQEQDRRLIQSESQNEDITLTGNLTVNNNSTSSNSGIDMDEGEEVESIQDCGEGIPAHEESDTAVSLVKTNHNDCADDVNDLGLDNPSAVVVVESAMEEQPLANTTQEDDDDAPTVLDYYFSVSTEAAFRIHRVQRTEDYQIKEETLHWELPSTYNISLVYKNCLKTHDCPYLHLHQDGVIVLAWLDFALSEWYVYFCDLYSHVFGHASTGCLYGITNTHVSLSLVILTVGSMGGWRKIFGGVTTSTQQMICNLRVLCLVDETILVAISVCDFYL